MGRMGAGSVWDRAAPGVLVVFSGVLEKGLCHRVGLGMAPLCVESQECTNGAKAGQLPWGLGQRKGICAREL